jgi:glutaryl-CoA dehydrogenase
MELARGDGSIYTFFGATSGFAINTIANLGSEEHKEKWIPGMARLEKLGAFALTEPEHGSDAVMLETKARREGDEYVIDGKKRWIGNGTVADVIIIWARDENDELGGFLVEKGSPGLHPIPRARAQHCYQSCPVPVQVDERVTIGSVILTEWPQQLTLVFDGT